MSHDQRPHAPVRGVPNRELEDGVRAAGELVHVGVANGAVVVAHAQELQAVVAAPNWAVEPGGWDGRRPTCAGRATRERTHELGEAAHVDAVGGVLVNGEGRLAHGVAQQVENLLLVDLGEREAGSEGGSRCRRRRRGNESPG